MVQKLFSFYSRLLLFFGGVILLTACHQIEDEEDKSLALFGVYRVEITLSGDIEGYMPHLFISPNYRSYYGKNHKFLPFEERYLVDSNTGERTQILAPFGLTYNYQSSPTLFNKPIIVYTSDKATGLKVEYWPTNPNIYTISESPKMQITIKGYKDGKLIKEETKEAPFNIKFHYFQIGENAMGQTE